MPIRFRSDRHRQPKVQRVKILIFVRGSQVHTAIHQGSDDFKEFEVAEISEESVVALGQKIAQVINCPNYYLINGLPITTRNNDSLPVELLWSFVRQFTETASTS